MKPLPENAEEYRALAKGVRTCVKKDHAAHRDQRLVKAAEARKIMKRCACELARIRLLTAALNDEDGTRYTERHEIDIICSSFYNSKVHVTRDPMITDYDADLFPYHARQEVETALRIIKNDKAPGQTASQSRRKKQADPIYERRLRILLALLEN